MLGCLIDQGELAHLAIFGTAKETTGDLFTLIHTVYEQVREKSPEDADKLKRFFTEHIDLAFKEADELHDEVEDEVKKNKKIREKVNDASGKAIERLEDCDSLDESIDILVELNDKLGEIRDEF